VLGVSAGGPYAAACAKALSDRVSGLAIVSGVGPIADVTDTSCGLPPAWRDVIRLARQDPATAREEAYRVCGAELELLRRDPDRWLADWEATTSVADQMLIADPVLRSMYIESCREATLEGYVDELLLLTTASWGFALDEISTPSIVWHGGQDLIISLSIAEYVIEHIPDCQAVIYPDEGHLLVHRHEEEILRRVASTLIGSSL
jgi:pimeloyl-ACP methyl ester carboxylesterase